MSKSKQEIEAGADAHADISPAKRAELEWLRARETDPSAPPPSPEIAREYAELESLLGDLPSLPEDERWHDRVLKAAVSRRRRALAMQAVSAGALIAAVVAIVVMARPGPRPEGLTDELAVAIVDGATARGTATRARLGDRLVVRAKGGAAGELRIYLNRRELVARCPGGPHCTSSTGSAGDQRIDLLLDAPGEYDVVLVKGASAALPGATLDAYLSAAEESGARVKLQTVDAR